MRERADEGSRHRGLDVSDTGAVPLGIALITVGALLLLDRTDALGTSSIAADWWPLALTLPGLWWLSTGQRTLGAILTIVGLLLLGDNLDLVEVSLTGLVWPAVLLVLGASLLRAGIALRRSARPDRTAVAGAAPSDGRDVGAWSATAVFGDARLVIPAPAAGARVQLAQTTAVFGDVEVEVPAGVDVVDRTTVLLGDVKLPAGTRPGPGAPVLELHGVVVFGDLRVRTVEGGEDQR